MPVLLVTGASGGLGKTVIDYYLQKKQFRVVACSRTTMEYQNELFQHISLDLTQETSAPQLSKTIQDQYGRLDFIINCIGISHSKLLYFTGSKDISSVYQTNVFAPFSVIKECSKIMIKNGGGKIINLSTIHVDLTTAGTSIYGSSKAALELITKVLAKEFSSNKIQINCLRLSAVENT